MIILFKGQNITFKLFLEVLDIAEVCLNSWHTWFPTQELEAELHF